MSLELMGSAITAFLKENRSRNVPQTRSQENILLEMWEARSSVFWFLLVSSGLFFPNKRSPDLMAPFLLLGSSLVLSFSSSHVKNLTHSQNHVNPRSSAVSCTYHPQPAVPSTFYKCPLVYDYPCQPTHSCNLLSHTPLDL